MKNRATIFHRFNSSPVANCGQIDEIDLLVPRTADQTLHRFNSSPVANYPVGPPSERSERPGGRFLRAVGPQVGGLVPLSVQAMQPSVEDQGAVLRTDWRSQYSEVGGLVLSVQATRPLVQGWAA